MEHGMCKCPHHKVIPALVVLFGLVFLLGTLNILTPGAVNIAWPVIIMVAGLTKMKSGSCKCCATPKA